MSGISREVTEHTINIKPGSKPVKQGLRRFNEEKSKAIREELARLLAVGFIKEVQHLDWMANPILVPKKRSRNGGCALTTRV
jgi:hypothetical protein